jgi:hypothetical protein
MPISLTVGALNRNYLMTDCPSGGMKHENQMQAIKGLNNQFPPHRFAKGYKENDCKNVSKCIMMHWIPEAFSLW